MPLKKPQNDLAYMMNSSIGEAKGWGKSLSRENTEAFGAAGRWNFSRLCLSCSIPKRNIMADTVKSMLSEKVNVLKREAESSSLWNMAKWKK